MFKFTLCRGPFLPSSISWLLDDESNGTDDGDWTDYTLQEVSDTDMGCSNCGMTLMKIISLLVYIYTHSSHHIVVTRDLVDDHNMFCSLANVTAVTITHSWSLDNRRELVHSTYDSCCLNN